MCTVVISSVLSVKALFVTSEPLNWTGTWQQHRLHTPTIKAFLCCFGRTCQLQQELLLLCLCQLIDLFFYFFSKESASTQEGEFMLVLLLQLAKPSFETQVFLSIASCFQIVIWRSVCAHNLQSSYIHLDWLCVCVCVREWGGVKQCEGKLSELCTEASRSVPRATGTPPPSPQGTKLLPHLHIYVAWFVQSLKSSLYYPVCLPICGMFYFEKALRQNVVLRITHCQFSKWTPDFSSGVIK